MLLGGRTHHLPERSWPLAVDTFALGSAVARHAPAHVSFIAHRVHTPIGADAGAVPHTNGRAHVPVHDILGYGQIGMVSSPLEGVLHQIGSRDVCSRVDALKQTAQHVMAHTCVRGDTHMCALARTSRMHAHALLTHRQHGE